MRDVNPKEWLALGEDLAPKLKDFDIINPHNFPSYIWAYYVKLRLGERSSAIIWYCHEPLRILYREITDPKGFRFYSKYNNPELKTIDMKAVSQIDHIVCNSRFTANNVEKIFNRAASVCHPGINMVETQDCDRKNFRMVTRIYREKNVERIINAMVLIRETRPDIYENCSFEIVGEGADEGRLKTLVKDIGISNIKFCGFIPDKELPAFYAGAKAIVYIPLDEPFGLVPLEAMFHKTPVIASNQGGIPEKVINGVTGILIDPVVIEVLTDAMQRIYDNPQLANELGTAGRTRVLERFTVDSFINKLEKKFFSLSGVK
ncbi:MAG: hypothetical protein CVU87_11275 [Firmicutes bacterium HGW-Firmicutes-12]|nr:MAG: hypothetical protein CVU87_11275 [Firmicutes bacterium HGW-Firmicutes-12]